MAPTPRSNVPLENLRSDSGTSGASTEPIERFKNKARNAQGHILNTAVFEWNDKCSPGVKATLDTVEELKSRPEADIRVVFAPADIPHPETVNGLTDLFQHFCIPNDFVNEGLRDVSLSLGNRACENEYIFTWFHFVCKHIEVERRENGLEIVHRGDNNERGEQAFRKRKQANFNWIRSGFVLKVSPSKPKSVALFCFGATESLLNKFIVLSDSGFDRALADPYVLLETVMEDMCWFVDERVWMVSEVFGDIEEKTIEDAKDQNRGKAGKEVDFPGLHSISKHIIYLQEAAKIAAYNLESLQSIHKEMIGITPTNIQKETQRTLEYRQSLVQSTQHRLASIDRRMANLMALSFNLVTQMDSRTMQKESKSMKTLAVVTLVFLPLTTVATIFGTQMFTINPDEPHKLRMSEDFWLLWAIAVPLTLVVLIAWRLWYRDARDKLEHGNQPRWRRWEETLKDVLRLGERRREDRPATYV
jgi:hypothetical protein